MRAPSKALQTLDTLALGARARVVAVRGVGGLRLRLHEMGFVPGAAIRMVKRAPFGDPLELQLRGGHVSLRRAEARRIEVDLLSGTGGTRS
ncbi:MAG: FeoA family protein [Nannocystaceae bacterium]